MKHLFNNRISIHQVEESSELAPKFDNNGLIPVITTDDQSGHVLMHGYMTAEALQKTIEWGEAVYYSRSRKTLWHKGKTSGFIQKVKSIYIDDDQDCIWLRVDTVGDANCHVGYKSCFYRKIAYNPDSQEATLDFTESSKQFDPTDVYGDAPNPTKL